MLEGLDRQVMEMLGRQMEVKAGLISPGLAQGINSKS